MTACDRMTGWLRPDPRPPSLPHADFLRSPEGERRQYGAGYRLARPRLPCGSRYDSRSRRSGNVRRAASSACLSCAALREDTSESRSIATPWRSLDLSPQQARQPHASQLRPILPPARLRSPARIIRFRQPHAWRRFVFGIRKSTCCSCVLWPAVPTDPRALKGLLLALVATDGPRPPRLAPTTLAAIQPWCTVGVASATTVSVHSRLGCRRICRG